MKKYIFLIVIAFFCSNKVMGQSNDSLSEPIVGQKCPNYSFQDISYFKQPEAKISDFKGKWLILDFWAWNCSGCISHFPETGRIQKKFKDKVQFLMVSYLDKPGRHRRLYKNYHDKLGLPMPSALIDSTFMVRNLNVGTLPHVVVIDPNGIVSAITLQINEKDSLKLRAMINGEKISFTGASFANEKEKLEKYKYDYKYPMFLNDNGGPDSNFIFRSILSKWNTKIPSNLKFLTLMPDARELKNNYLNRGAGGRYEIAKAPLMMLYSMAYLGTQGMQFAIRDSSLRNKYWPVPLLEVKNDSLFKYDYASAKNVFCYSLIVPPNKASEVLLKQMMQNDLRNYFGFEVSVETRKMPYWKLVASNNVQEKIKSKGGPRKENLIDWHLSTFQNTPFVDFVPYLEWFSGIENTGANIVDDTGINFNIDGNFDWVKNDPDSVIKELRKHGLDLIKSERELKVVIIRDPNSIN